MGIQISNSMVQPQVIFDKVFLQRLSIDQYAVTDDGPLPKYRVTIEYRLYGVKDGIRYYQNDIRELEVKDFIDEAMKRASTGDTVLINSLPVIESAIASLVASDLNTSAEVI